MKRELKFRVWKPRQRAMFNPIETIDIIQLPQVMLDKGIDILMQYIGLKDCKGKEVYEGDILELDIDDKEKTIKNRIYVVWQDSTSGYIFRSVINNSLMVVYHTDIISNWKIIGNIYENPNLLNA